MTPFKNAMDCYGPLFGLKDNLQKIADGCGPDNMDLVYLSIKGCIAHIDDILDAVSNGGHRKAAAKDE